jgi:hypothetical protein
LIAFGSKLGELFLLHLKQNERIGNVGFRDEIDLQTAFRKEFKSLKVLSSKSRVRVESHIDFQLVERMLVAAACLVGIKERM